VASDLNDKSYCSFILKHNPAIAYNVCSAPSAKQELRPHRSHLQYFGGTARV